MSKTKTKADEPTLRDRLLAAAKSAFGDKGYEGARMDEIARVAGASKQVVYHHFQSKEGLFEEVLRRAYAEFRGRDDMLRGRISALPAVEALREFVEFLFSPSQDAVRFQNMVQDENRFMARHARQFQEARTAYGDLIDMLEDILDRGQAEGVFRTGVDATELYVTLAGVFMFRMTNAHTLSAMLDVPLSTEEGARASRESAIRFIVHALAPLPGGG